MWYSLIIFTTHESTSTNNAQTSHYRLHIIMSECLVIKIHFFVPQVQDEVLLKHQIYNQEGNNSLGKEYTGRHLFWWVYIYQLFQHCNTLSSHSVATDNVVVIYFDQYPLVSPSNSHNNFTNCFHIGTANTITQLTYKLQFHGIC